MFLVMKAAYVYKELHKALEEVKIFSGSFPISASCKKIRDDQGYWNQMVTDPISSFGIQKGHLKDFNHER